MAKATALELELLEKGTPRAPLWRRLLRLAGSQPLGVVGLCFIGLILFCAAFADYIMPHNPQEIAVGPVSEGPSWSHPFGTDRLGTDTFSRTIFGARIAMIVGMSAILFGTTTGSAIGIASGYFGGIVDSILQRLIDSLLAYPAVVLLLAIIAVVGDEDSPVKEFLREPEVHLGFLGATIPLGPAGVIPEGTVWGVPNFLDVIVIALAIGLAVAVGTARVVRGAVLSLKENMYIEAARAMGASDFRIMLRHIFPNVAALVVVLSTIFLPIAILAEAAISFLGVGVPAGTPSWGADIGDPSNRAEAFDGSWWVVFFPGLALSIVVLGFNLVGDAFRDISDPRLRGGGGTPGM